MMADVKEMFGVTAFIQNTIRRIEDRTVLPLEKLHDAIQVEEIITLEYLVFDGRQRQCAENVPADLSLERSLSRLGIYICLPLLKKIYGDRKLNCMNARGKWREMNNSLQEEGGMATSSSDERGSTSELAQVCMKALMRCIRNSSTVTMKIFELCVDSVITLCKASIDDMPVNWGLQQSAPTNTASELLLPALTLKSSSDAVKTIPMDLAISLISGIYDLDPSTLFNAENIEADFKRWDGVLYETVCNVLARKYELVSSLLPLIRKLCVEHRCHSSVERLLAIFTLIKTMNKGEQKGTTAFSVFSCLVDLYLPIEMVPDFDVRAKKEFWLLLQSGLLHDDPLTRKRAMFIMKRALNSVANASNKKVPFVVHDINGPIFWWNYDYAKKISDNWEAFFLLMETLNEKQIHIVMPVLSNFDDILESVIEKCPGYEHGYIDISWLLTILKKGFQHESKVIVKWAIHTTLTLKSSALEMLMKFGEEFIFHSLLQSLGHEYLYSRASKASKGDPPWVLQDLTHFFKGCMEGLVGDARVAFMQKVILRVCESGLNGVPFFFIIKALSEIEEKNVITDEILEVMRNTLSCCLSTFPVKVRRGISYCFTKLLFSNMDASSVSAKAVGTFLCVLLEAQHLSLGDPLWHSIIEWTVNCTQWFNSTSQSLTAGDEKPSNIFLMITAALFGENIHDILRLVIIETNRFRTVLMMFWAIDLFSYLCQSTLILQNEEMRLSVNDSVSECFRTLVDFIKKLNTNPYLSEEQVNNVLQFVANSLQYILKDKSYRQSNDQTYTIGSNMYTLLSHTVLLGTLTETFESLLHYVRTIWVTSATSGNVEKASLCLNLQALIFKCYHTNASLKGNNTCLTHLDQSLELCANFLKNVRVLRKELGIWYVLNCLVFVVEHIPLVCSVDSKSKYFDRVLQAIKGINIISYENERVDKNFENRETTQGIGSVYISNIIASFWEVIFHLLNNGVMTFDDQSGSQPDISGSGERNLFLTDCNVTALVHALVETFHYVSSKDIIPLLNCLQVLLPLISEISTDQTISALEETWRLVSEQNRRDISYWTLLSHFTSVFFNPCLLHGDNAFIQRMLYYWKELYTIGVEKGGVFNSVIDYITTEWMNVDWNGRENIYSQFSDAMAEAIIFGQIYRKNMIILRDTKEYISTTISDELDEEDGRHDFLVRTKVISFCYKMHRKIDGDDFMHSLIKCIIDKDATLSTKWKRYFQDSLVHRQKLRLWQAVLVFLDGFVLPTLSAVDDFISKLFQALYFDNQPSVRRLIEWVTVLVFEKYYSHIDRLWERIQEGGESRIGILTSLISIVYHLGWLLDESRLFDFTDTALAHLLRWTQVQHMQVKLHAQVVLQHFWSLSNQKEWSNLTQKYQAITDCFKLTETNSSIVKHRRELANSFFFSSFHAVKHYSLETIFSKFLQLSGVADDEWLDCTTFDLNDKHRLQIYDDLDVEVTCENMDEKKIGSAEGNGKSSKDVQKKITPFNVLPPMEDPLFRDTYKSMRDEGESQLILCASLIDRTPNLGGLCRTCEIFGVNTLVLGSLKHLQDTTFKSLSVSSERWVNIEQIVPRKLVLYLQEKKEEGYRIVGVEQTAESHTLEKYRFDLKTVLLLGNEKEGIPVDIIQLVDDCVEIPQQGIIRSLNVHVSGAITMWEYNKQRLLNKK